MNRHASNETKRSYFTTVFLHMCVGWKHFIIKDLEVSLQKYKSLRAVDLKARLSVGASGKKEASSEEAVLTT
jgi:hypothetical protein